MLLKDLEIMCHCIYDSLDVKLFIKVQDTTKKQQSVFKTCAFWKFDTYCICVSPVFYHFLGLDMHLFLCCSFCTKGRCLSCQPVKAIPNPFPLSVWNYGDLAEIHLAR